MRSTTIIVVGTGGIGTGVAYALASFPFSRLVLIDDDTVEASNLNRQFLFDLDDVGTPKVSTLRTRLLERFPHATIETHQLRADEQLLTQVARTIDGLGLAVVSADSSNVLLDSTRVFARHEIPHVNVGYFNDISAIGPMWIDHESACGYCDPALGLTTDAAAGSRSEVDRRYSAPSTYLNNAMAVAMALSDIISCLAGDRDNIVSLNRRVGIGNVLLDRFSIDVSPNPGCAACRG